ncbi:hypothetical protein NMG60_11027265 [Bertholletia excelsa]
MVMGFSKIAALAVVVAVVMHAAEGQKAPTPSCASKLVACADYLNATKPPASCCNPLREAITNEMPCLCSLYNSGSLPSLGINVTDALTLPKRCKIPGDLDSCVKAASPTSSAPASQPPPVPAATANQQNGVGRIVWTGMSGLLPIWALLMLF